MNLYLDTSTATAIVKLSDATAEHEYRAELGHAMAEQLLSFLEECLNQNHLTWQGIRQITFFSGPGSFTGLRIGAAIVNTLAHELGIPLYDHHGVRHEIIIPDYGRPARITAPKK